MQPPFSRFTLRRALWCALLVGVPLAGAGCGRHADTSGVSASTGGTSSTSTPQNTASVPVGPPVTDAEAQQFTDRLLAAIKSGDTNTLNGMLDLDAIAAASLAGLGLSDKDKNDFMTGIRSSLNQSNGVTGQLVASVAGGGSSGLLRFVDVGGRKAARVRMVHPNNGGVGYVDFVLGHNASGQVMAQDMYIFYSGEMLTATMHRLAVQAAASQNRSLLERLTGVDNEFVTHMNDIKTMSQDLAMGSAAAAMQTYNALPDTLKADKTMKLIRIRIAEKLGDAEYERALADFRASFPTDPATSLLSIDFYLLKKQYAKSLTAVDDLDKTLGGDPYLDVIRAEIYIFLKDRSKAQAAIARAIKALPDDQGAQQLQQALAR